MTLVLISLEYEIIKIYKQNHLVQFGGSLQFRAQKQRRSVDRPLGRGDEKGEKIEVGCFCSAATLVFDSTSL